MKLSNVVNGLIGVAEELVPAIVPGATPVIAAATKLVDLINEVSENPHLETQQLAVLEASRAELERRVNEHAGKTAESLD